MHQYISCSIEHKTKSQNEHGLVFLTFSVSVLAIFILIGLAIDSANLFIGKLNVQSAADAAALSGLGQVVTNRDSPDFIAEAVVAARLAARANMVANRISESSFRWDPENNNFASSGVVASYNDATGVFRVQIDYDVRLHLISGLPGMNTGTSRRVSAVGQAQVRNANIALVLDTSASMSCPDTPEGDFACPCLGRSEADGGDCDGSLPTSKLSALKAGVEEFLKNFESKDGISVTAFGHGAELIKGFTPAQGPTVIPNVISAVKSDDLGAEGATNLFDGIFTAYEDAREKDRMNDLFFVVFSDGAPTAARFHFTKDSVDSRVRNRKNDTHNNVVRGAPAWANWDWMSWGLIVTDDADAKHTIPNQLYLTPPPTSTFVLPEAYGNRGYNGYWNKRKMSLTDPPVPPGIVVGAGRNNSRSVRRLETPESAFRGNGNQLLHKLEVSILGSPPVRLGRPQLWGCGGPNKFCWDNWSPGLDSLWIYSDIAIHLADEIRSKKKAVFFTIGYGGAAGEGFEMDGSAGISCVADSPDGPVIKCTDPYQDARQASFRKDILNRRLALSLCGYNDPAFYGIDLDPLQLKLVTDAKQHGESYATDTPENLKLAFDRIARKIKIRRASNF